MKNINTAYYSMAETSTSTSASNKNMKGSPITNLAPDQLFSILLLLPIDSILAFAMTCKRFKALACSDTLWESICRRDWGPNAVDVLKSSNFQFQQQWMRLYRQISKLESVSCHKMTYPDGEFELPKPRASHSLDFVSDCLVLFGGGCEGGKCFS